MGGFTFGSVTLPPEAKAYAEKARAFLREEQEAGLWKAHRSSWSTFDAGFSKRAGAAGLIGLTFPTEYGGHGQSSLVRFAVTEEMLAAGAPCGAHWVADRQSGPQLLKHGSERVRREIVPRIAAGECYFGIGMSEPGSGSDLAAVRTKATRVEGGWRIDGQKIWTTNAHHAHYLIALVRTGEAGENRHEGLTQMLVDLASPGITVRPILDISGNHEFNEVFFDGVFTPDDHVIGEVGNGWAMVTGELAFERSGPDRYLSDFRLLAALVDRVGTEPGERQAGEIGRLVAHLVALRRMSASVSESLDRGMEPSTEAALVKEMGNAFEREIPEIARRLAPAEPDLLAEGDIYVEGLADVTLRAPCFTLRGGTREILRGVIARQLGLRG
jgi:alkylation response protein AidB-like acyl-CoA dehydrogenase